MQVASLTTLESALAKTEGLIRGVNSDQGQDPTPCDEFNVARLLSHMVGWLNVFADAANGHRTSFDPTTYQCGQDPAEEFRIAGEKALTGWKSGSTEVSVTLVSSPMPGRMVLGMNMIEVLGHGWDLATATKQNVPFDEPEARIALSAARDMLRPEYRGQGMAFGHEVEVPNVASVLDTFVAFIGRTPPRRASWGKQRS